MIDKKQINIFRHRWGIATSDEEEFNRLRNRIANQLDEDAGSLKHYKYFRKAYARMLGMSQQRLDNALLTWAFGAYATGLGDECTFPELMGRVQTVLWALLESGSRNVAENLAKNISRTLELSPGLDASILINADEVTIYPAGAAILDEKLVEETLEWLEGYSDVAKHFYEALKIYADKETTKYRNLLDNLRFALEQMLRIVLKNKKSLENQQVEALKWLSSHKIHTHVINMYNDLITKFASYQNDAVKHNERYSPTEIEFMIYLTGTFLRFLVQLHRAEQPALIQAAKTP